MPVRVAQYGFSGGEWAPSLMGRTDIDKYALSLRKAKNVLIAKYGGVLNRAGTEFIGEVKDSADTTRLLPFQFNTAQAYVLEFGDEVMRPIKDDGQILEAAKNIVDVSTAAQGVIEVTGHGFSNGDHVYFDDAVGGVSILHERVLVVSDQTTDTFKVKDLFGNYVATTGYTYTAGGTVARLYQLTLTYDQTHVFDLGYAQTADTMYLTHLSYPTAKLTRSGHASWSITTVTWGPTLSAPAGLTASVGSGSGSTAYLYKVSAFDEDTNEESLPSTGATVSNDLTVAGYYNSLSWSSVAGADRYIIYKAENGVYGFIGGTTGLTFRDDNILPDLGDAPPASRDPFTASSDYPAVCGFHGGRLVLGQTTLEPGGVWMSQSTRYENLNVSTPAKADDAVSFVLSPGVNAVRALVSINKLAIFTSEREFTADGGGVQSAITPASLDVRKHTRRGSAALPAIEVGDIALFVQRQGAVVRAFGYSYEKDGYRTNDLTLLAPHLFRGHTIVDWCYQQDPDSIVWCVRDDGVLLALTFVEEQNTFAWTACYIGGTFGSGASATGFGVVESCACIEGPDQDDVYLIVKRTINGATKRYIEKLVKRWDGDAEEIEAARFLDSHKVFTSADATSTVTGLWHLEGLSVMALADGNVQGPFTVSAGSITLNTALIGTDDDTDSQAIVGLSYVSDVVDLPLAMQTETGAPQGKTKNVSDVVLKLHHTRGVKVGDYDDLLERESKSLADRLVELKERDFENWNDPIAPYTGDTLPIKIDGHWSMDASVIVRQEYPLPMEIQMIARNVTVDGK